MKAIFWILMIISALLNIYLLIMRNMAMLHAKFYEDVLATSYDFRLNDKQKTALLGLLFDEAINRVFHIKVGRGNND